MSNPKLLSLEPKDELRFYSEHAEEVNTSSLHLTNGNDQYVAFKVWTTNPAKYVVMPSIGIIKPRSTLVIQVWSVTLQSGDQFMVRSFITPPGSTIRGIQTEMFEVPRNIMEEYILKVVYVLRGNSQSSAPKDSSTPVTPQGVSSEVKQLLDDPHTKEMAKSGDESTPCEVIGKFSNQDSRNIGQDHTTKNLEDKDKEELVDSLLRELEKLREKQEDEQKKADDLKRTVEVLESIFRTPKYSEFSYIELQQATNDFENSLKIGEGGYGSVYKGFLRHTTVAVKKLDCQSMQGLPEFYQEVDILTKVRHPNLVNFIGACSFPEPCLVYEFLPNGSLEDRLSCKDNTPPLSWQDRIRIATEICSALIFLHSNKPHSVVHGDLKPSNILLDAKLVTKVSDFGISRLLTQSSATTNVHHTEPKGTFPYIDPEFGHTGELTLSSDVYSFGVIILQLLTGRPALGMVKAVQDAFTSENLQNILDESAGEWPFLQAKRLACLGLECCKMDRRTRPRLEMEVWRVLEPMVKASSLESTSFHLKQADNNHIPSYFLCPILQEVMQDPQVSADGFTYEKEAIKGWFDSGHNTSPMTNLELPHHELLPNRALRSVIQEWLQQEYRHFP